MDRAVITTLPLCDSVVQLFGAADGKRTGRDQCGSLPACFFSPSSSIVSCVFMEATSINKFICICPVLMVHSAEGERCRQ